MKARIVVGANYGDEGKGTVVAKYTKESTSNGESVLNVLTNGGAQRGHTIKTKDGYITYQHFGSGTYYGADNYYSRFFVLNPIQFTEEHRNLVIKPNKIYRDPKCKWSTIYDMMANYISEQQRNRHASCCMGIWYTIQRYQRYGCMAFDDFMNTDEVGKFNYLMNIKKYYEQYMDIPSDWKELWDNPYMAVHFIEDCHYMFDNTEPIILGNLYTYDNLIFENGQGLLLSDTGKDDPERTPSCTGIPNALNLLSCFGSKIETVTTHYVSRTYLTRHGDGVLRREARKSDVSGNIEEDFANHYNEGQGEFRYGLLNMKSLKERIDADAYGIDYELELTHCDEVDLVDCAHKYFNKVNVIDSPLV